MKKTYISPKAEVVVVNTACSILAGSMPGAKTTGYDPSEDALAPIFDDLDEDFFK